MEETIKNSNQKLYNSLINKQEGDFNISSTKLITYVCDICGTINVKQACYTKQGISCSNKNCENNRFKKTSKKLKDKRIYNYKIGDVLENQQILEQIEIDANKKGNFIKGYKIKCLKCGYEYERNEYKLNNGQGCPCCKGKTIVKGVNDIATVRPDLIKYFVDENYAYTHTERCSGHTRVKCLDCGEEKDMLMTNLSKKGFKCDICTDGISYSEKILFNLLKQFDICFEREKSFKTKKQKKFDFYIKDKKCIIETHGIQHYDGSFSRLGGRTLEEEQENDRFKEQFAKENGIEHYVVLDCRKSELEWIKNSIINSELLILLGIKSNEIDWVEIEKLSQTSIVKQACDLYSNGKTVKEICSILKLSNSCICDYLKKGEKLGWCDYCFEKFFVSKRKKVYYNGTIFNSLKELTQYINKPKSTVIGWINGNNPIDKKFKNIEIRYATDKDLDL